MKIVVLDGYTENPGDITWKPLEAFGDVTVYDRTSYVESPLIAERIGDAEIVVVNKTPISKSTIDKCPNLKAIAVLATGYNVVDYEYAKSKGIPVQNVPVYGTDNVSQFAVSLLLEVCSHIGHHDQSVHAGEWASNADWCYWHYPLIEVSGKTAGIIGLGRIGYNTARILRAMNVDVLAYDTFENEAGKSVAAYVSLDVLLSKSDFIFLHSRGQLIIEQDLYDALESGKVAAAALDVVSTEPIKSDNILLKAKNCIITPHISWATKEARERIMNTTAENIRSVIDGAPINVVNK